MNRILIITSIVTAAAVLIYTVFAGLQWWAIRKQAEHTASQASTMRGQLDAMKGQEAAMRDQLELMKRQMENAAVSARAYLGIKSVGITNPITRNTIVINAVMFNGGQTPAWNVEPKFQVGLVEGPPQPFDWNAPANQVSDAGLTSTFFPAGAEKRITFPQILNVTKEHFGEFEGGKRNIYVDGEVRFTDHMGIKQIFGFGMLCTFNDNGQFRERYQYQRNENPN